MPATTRPPPAPSKTRSAPTRSTRTTRNTSPSSSLNIDLASSLTTLSLDTATRRPVKSNPTTATRRAIPPSTTSSARSTAINKPVPSTSSSRPLAESKVASRTEEEPTEQNLTVEERSKQASAIISTSLATLAELARSGFRAERSTPSATATPTPSSRSSSSARPGTLANGPRPGGIKEKEKAESAAKDAGKAFGLLRTLGKDNVRLGNKRASIEGMAGRFIAELINVELYRYALIELSAMRASILSWYSSSTEPPIPLPTAPLLSHTPSLLVPLPPPSFFSPATLTETLSTTISRPSLTELVPLVLALQQALFQCFFRSSTLSSSPEAQRSRIEKLEAILRKDGSGEDGGGPLDWRNLWENLSSSQEIDEKKKSMVTKTLDGMMLGMFNTIMNGSSSAEEQVAPEILLNFRAKALLYYSSMSSFTSSSTTTSQLSAFHTQHRKILLRYGRTAQAAPYTYSLERIAKEAKEVFQVVLRVLEEKQLDCQGNEWKELCEVVLYLAKKGNDHSLIALVSKNLESPQPSSSPSPSSSPAAIPASPLLPPADQASQLLMSIHRLLALFDLFSKSPNSTNPSSDIEEIRLLLPILRRTSTYIERAGKLRSLPDDSGITRKLSIQLDQAIEQIRATFNRFMRTPTTAPNSSQSTTRLRSDQLVTQAGTDKPVQSNVILNEVHKLVRESLNAIVGVVERSTTSRMEDQQCRIGEVEQRDLNLRTAAVDTLILLAHDSLVILDRSTHTAVFIYLSRALPLLKLPSNSHDPDSIDLEASYSIHSLATTLYNIGIWLYEAGMADAAIRFGREACLLTREALETFAKEADDESDGLFERMNTLKLDGEEEEDDERRDSRIDEDSKREKTREEKKLVRTELEKNVGRRWNLLALAHHTIGDRQAAYESYLKSIVSQPPTILSSLETDASQQSFSTLLESYSPLFKAVDRATRIGTFDLLLSPDQISLSHAFSSQPPSLAPAIQGILLEFQIAALDQFLERTSSQRAISAILTALDKVYTAREYPIRRARTLIRRMQHLCVGNQVAQDLKPAALAAEIDELCSNPQAIGRDAALQPYSAQYLSLSHLYLAFHAHHSKLTSPASVVEFEANQALSILRKALDGDLPSSPSGPASNTSKVTFQASPVRSPIDVVVRPTTTTTRQRPTRSTATPAKSRTALKTPQTTRTLAVSRRGNVDDQVTPPKKTILEEAVAVKLTPAKKGDPARASLDGPDKVYRLLETMTSLLGTLGYSLLKISFLKFLRRLSSKLLQDVDAAFVTSSALLAHEYLLLGKTIRAGTILAQAEQRTQSASKAGTTLSPAVEVLRLLSHAEYFAVLGNHDRASRSYETAMSVAELVARPVGSASETIKIVEATLTIQRVAFASSVYSVMLQRRGDLARSLAPAMQAVRLYNRALGNISRLETSQKASRDQVPLFTAPPNDHITPLNDFPSQSRKPTDITAGGAHAGLSWQIAEQLAQSIIRASNLYFVRGSPKDAEFYATQAIDLARDLSSDRMIARATASRVEVRILIGNSNGADIDLKYIEELIEATSCPEAVELRRLRADLHLRNSLQQQAYSLCLDAQKSLEYFIRNAAEAEASQTPIRRSISAKQFSPAHHRSATKTLSPYATFSSSPNNRGGNLADWILPAAHAYILRMQVAILRSQNKSEESQTLLKRLSKISSFEEDKADELRLLASIHLQDMLSRCTSDPVLGMLPDSVLSIPAMGSSVSTAIKIGTPRTGPTLLNSLKDVDTLLTRAAAYSASRSQPNKLRELSLITGTMRAFYANVGKPSKRAAVNVAHVLDLGTAVNLRREMLDAIDHKLDSQSRHDDLLWPTTSSEESNAYSPERQLLLTMRDRYRLETPEPALTDPSMSSLLPPKWTSISLHLNPERDNIIIVRHRRDSEPVVFKLPLDRLARREGEEETFTYDDAIGELKDIIASTNNSAKVAKNIETSEDRDQWWQEREQLDERLKELLQMIEDVWLGAFKSIFYDARSHPSEAFASFRSRIERILKRTIVRAAQDKKSTRFKLNDAVVECIAALPATSREEDLEDLFFFMAEAFQFSGVPVACDETDVDQVVVDLREALEELHGTKSAPKGVTDPDENTFLILDKTLGSFPWESLPCLRGRSVSRLPSLSFLRDRLDLASSLSPENPSSDIVVDPSRAAFVLNPGGDLARTQGRFEPWLNKQVETSNWSGIVGRAPLPEEMKTSLSSKELFLYFGHGGAEQYIRHRMVRHLPRCAVTMLWGCSSGILKDQGDFDPTGTPYNYMIAGCPALVANLWDVTDKDIDKFAQSVFIKTGIASSTSPPPTSTLSLTAAVAQSRNQCHLRYLNGAAPVVYGIPVRFLQK